MLDTVRPRYKESTILAWNAWKRCCKKVDSQGEHFTGMHDRFLRDPDYRESQLAIGWTEQKCKEWDELAKEDHTYRLTPEEKKRYQGQGYLTLNEAGKNGPMKLRSDFRAAVSVKNRLHHESGEQVEETIHPDQYSRWHPSSSTSWWDKSDWKWKWAHETFELIRILFGGHSAAARQPQTEVLAAPPEVETSVPVGRRVPSFLVQLRWRSQRIVSW